MNAYMAEYIAATKRLKDVSINDDDRSPLYQPEEKSMCKQLFCCFFSESGMSRIERERKAKLAPQTFVLTASPPIARNRVESDLLKASTIVELNNSTHTPIPRAPGGKI